MQQKSATDSFITIIGGGLAGCEACFQIAKRGRQVRLYEMRPGKTDPVHKTGNLAELVCSNSLGSDSKLNASGLLKAELRKLNSLIIEAADNTRVPAGQALAVDRNKFSAYIQERITSFSNVEIIRREITEILTDGIIIIATGPLTSEAFAENLSDFLGKDFLYFYDAVSPIITAESINMNRTYEGSRYRKGTPDYLNCPMSEEEYDRFYEYLIHADRVDPHDFERGHFFEGCMPIEEMAERGKQTLLFGPLKPVGLDKKAKAVVQLRKENKEGTLYSLVGFQTRLRWKEQESLIRLIPGLERAEIVRYGVMHKNIYVDSPRLLCPTLNLKGKNRIFLAGQITGVEGYVESTAMGLIAGLNAYRSLCNIPMIVPPEETMIGSLIRYITDEDRRHFQPMNANFGIIPTIEKKNNKKERKQAMVERALRKLDDWITEVG